MPTKNMAKKRTLKEPSQGSAALGLAHPDSVQNISEHATSSEGNFAGTDSAKANSPANSVQADSKKSDSPKSDSPKSDPAKAGSAQAAPAHPIAVSRDNAQHYRWGNDCDGWHLVKDKQLTVIEEFMPPGAAEIRHYHERAQQFFYILTGEVLMEINGENMLIPAGSGVRILPGTRHQVRNPSSSPVRFLVVSQPPSHGDRIDE
jgi:mannose-6-phosphate isomerase-like protein (cupin superfamily)